MPSTATLSCPRCGRDADAQALMCGLCGEVLRRAAAAARPSRPTPILPAQGMPEPERTDALAEQRARREPWIYFWLGLVTAPIFSLTPLLGMMGWFLASLVHEMGHSAVAWFFGMPSVPAIALDGHAAAVHSDQQLFLVAMIALALGTTAWRCLSGTARIAALIAVVVLYPALAFTGARELLHLAGGHAGELAFAVLALWKALDGGFTDSRAERLLYGTLGWFLAGKNALLAWGLATSASSRAWYAENGSFGLTNDYIRIAEDLLGWRLESVAWLALLASLAAVPAAMGLWRLLRASP
jgi:hypothetical protein